MLITMFTDVALIHDVGGYAVWARESRKIIRHADLFAVPMHDPKIAEICGIINGLSLVIRRSNAPAGSKIIVESLSEIAVQVLRGANRHPSFTGLVESRNAVLAGRGILVDYLHVQRKAVARLPCSDWCYRESKRVVMEYQGAMT